MNSIQFFVRRSSTAFSSSSIHLPHGFDRTNFLDLFVLWFRSRFFLKFGPFFGSLRSDRFYLVRLHHQFDPNCRSNFHQSRSSQIRSFVSILDFVRSDPNFFCSFRSVFFVRSLSCHTDEVKSNTRINLFGKGKN